MDSKDLELLVRAVSFARLDEEEFSDEESERLRKLASRLYRKLREMFGGTETETTES